MEKRKLPSIQELHSDVEMKIQENDFNILMNNTPPQAWLKIHPYGKFNYIPIERIEWLLTRILIKWSVEIKEVALIANSVVVTIRLHYSHPVTGDKIYHDGVGASPLQTNKDASPVDFSQMKSIAVQLAAPAAESYAIKDAAEKIGRIFGKDINREDTMSYEFGGQFDEVIKNNLIDKTNYAYALIRNCTLEESRKDELESELLDITIEKCEEMITMLKDCQLSGTEKPGYNQGDINDQLDMQMDKD